MPVTVSATLTQSHWPRVVHGSALILSGFFAFALFGVSYLIITMLIFTYLLTFPRSAASSVQHIHWQGSEIRLVEEKTTSSLIWTGYGRQSFAFIKLEVQCKTGRRVLVVWKDQVSDASWRALNMAFSVWQPVIMQQLELAKAQSVRIVP